MKKYIVTGNIVITHNSQKYVPNDTIELEDNEAMRLRLYLEPVPDKKSRASGQEKDKAESTDPKQEPESESKQEDIFQSKKNEQNKE